MKHIFSFCLAVLFSAPALFAQNADFQAFIDRNQQEPHFSFVLLTEKLFECTLKSDVSREDLNGLKKVVQNLGSLRILSADSITNGHTLFKEVRQIAENGYMEEMLAVRDGSDQVRIWVKEADGVVSDLVLVAGDRNEFTLVCFAGKLDLTHVTELADIFEHGRAEKLIATTQAQSVDFSISPNPATEVISIQFSAEGDAPQRLSIIDALGRVQKVIDLSKESPANLSLGLPSGMYWLQLETRQGKVGVEQLQVLR